MRALPTRWVRKLQHRQACLLAKLIYFALCLHLLGEAKESLQRRWDLNITQAALKLKIYQVLLTSQIHRSISRQEFLWKFVPTVNQSIALTWSAHHKSLISFIERFKLLKLSFWKEKLCHGLIFMKAKCSTCNFKKYFIQLHKLIPYKEVPKAWFVTCICPYCNSSNSLLPHRTSSTTNKCYQRASPLLSVLGWKL